MPEIEITGEGIMIKCFPSKIYLNLLTKSLELNMEDKNGGLNGGKSDSDIEKDILNFITLIPNITQLQLSTKLGVPLRTIQRCISNLKEQKAIERYGSKKKGYWVIK